MQGKEKKESGIYSAKHWEHNKASCILILKGEKSRNEDKQRNSGVQKCTRHVNNRVF